MNLNNIFDIESFMMKVGMNGSINQETLSKLNLDVIVLDVDGVLLDFNGGFKKTAQNILGKEIFDVKRSYSLKERYALTEKEHKVVWTEMDKRGLGELPMLPNADIAFNMIKEAGFKIHLVTGIWEESKGLRLENLAAYNMYPDGIDCIGDGITRKDSFIQKVKPIAFVDDRLQHINDNLAVPIRCWIDHNEDQFGLTEEHVTYKTDNVFKWARSCGLFDKIENTPKVNRKLKF